MRKAARSCSSFLTILSLWLPVYQPSDAAAESTTNDDWELVKTDAENDIRIYYRNLSSGNVEFKGVTQIEASLSGIIAVFLDFETMPQWLYRTEKVTLLERITANEIYIHTIHTMPLPFRDRDSANYIRLSQSLSSKMVTIDVTNAPAYIQSRDDYVRVPVAVSQWRLQPLENGQVRITFSGYGEPGGSISSQAYRSSTFQWLIKQFLWKVPYKSLRGLKEYARRDKYRHHSFDFITEGNDRE